MGDIKYYSDAIYNEADARIFALLFDDLMDSFSAGSRFANILRPLFKVNRHTYFIELGAGTGSFIKGFRKQQDKHIKYIALDISMDMLILAPKSIRCVQADMFNLPLNAKNAIVVISPFILEVIPNRGNILLLLKEIQRCFPNAIIGSIVHDGEKYIKEYENKETIYNKGNYTFNLKSKAIINNRITNKYQVYKKGKLTYERAYNIKLRKLSEWKDIFKCMAKESKIIEYNDDRKGIRKGYILTPNE